MTIHSLSSISSKRIILLIVCVAVVSIVAFLTTPTASAALVPQDELPRTLLVQQSPEELLSAECTLLSPATSEGYVDVPAGKPLQVASFSNQTQRWMCPAASMSTLTLAEGKVAGLRAAAVCSPLSISPLGAINTALEYFDWGLCSSIYNAGAEYVADSTAQVIVGFILLIISIPGMLAAWVLQMVSIVLGIVLAKGDFVSDPFVRTGWPFVQGVVNIGFVFILLFIAFATTIGYEAANARRTLPRLLIAVVLVNFSLIIGGFIIDISRVMTALFLGAVGYNPHAVGAGLMRATDLISGVWGLESSNANVYLFDFTSGASAVTQGTGGHFSRSLRVIMSALAANAMIVGYTIAVVFLTVFFFIRRVMLLLLLIISPIAYLTWVLPNTQSIASRWWSEFIKWAMFGPAAAFLLALIVNLGTQADFLGSAGSPPLDFLNNHVRISILAVMLFITAMIGQYIGGVAGNLSVSMGKRANRMLYRYTGAQAAVGLARNQTRDFASTIRKGIRERAKKTPYIRRLVPRRRDAQGNLLRGQTSWGQALGRTITGRGFDPKETARRNRRLEMRNAGTEMTDVANPEGPYKAGNLSLQEVGETISPNQIDAVIQHAELSGDFSRVLELARNPYAVDNMSPQQKSRIASYSINNTYEDTKDPDTGENITRVDAIISSTGMPDPEAGLPNGRTGDIPELNRQIRDVRNALRRSVEETDSERW